MIRFVMVLVAFLASQAGAADPTPAPGALFLPTEVDEGSDYTLTMTLSDRHGLPLVPSEVAWWGALKGHGGKPDIFYTGTPITDATTNVIPIDLPPEVNKVVDDGLPVERHIIVVRVKAGTKNRTFFPEYNVTNSAGFGVIGGELVPLPTPTRRP